MESMANQSANNTEEIEEKITDMKGKISDVRLLADELRELLSFVDEEVSAVQFALKTEKQDEWNIKSNINRLEMVESLLRKFSDMEPSPSASQSSLNVPDGAAEIVHTESMEDQSANITKDKDWKTGKVEAKIDNVKSQASKLRNFLHFVDVEVSAVQHALKTEKQDQWKIRGNINRLEMVESLLIKFSDMEPSPSASQSSLNVPDGAAGSSDFSQLIRRVEAIEATLFRNHEDDLVTVQLSEYEHQLQELQRKFQDISKMQTEHFSRLDLCEGKMDEMETYIKNMKVQLQNGIDHNAEVVSQQGNKTGNFEQQIVDLQSEIEKCNINQEKEIALLQLKTSHLEDSMKALVSRIEMEEKNSNKLKDRILLAAKYREEDLKRLLDLDNMWKQICQIVAENINPLRRLQDILNSRSKRIERDRVFSQIEVLSGLVGDLSNEVSRLDIKVENAVPPIVLKSSPPAGFTAYCPSVIRKMTSCAEIKEFTDVRCNEGGCYDPGRGVFTAPRDGLYFASVTLRQRREGTVDVHVVRCSGGRIDVVCKSSTHSDKKSSCGVGVVKMKSGDSLFVKTINIVSDPSLSHYSSFSCF